jgi:hypothetical protein
VRTLFARSPPKSTGENKPRKEEHKMIEKKKRRKSNI